MIELLLALTLINPKVNDEWVFGFSCEQGMITINADHPLIKSSRLTVDQLVMGYGNAWQPYQQYCAGEAA